MNELVVRVLPQVSDFVNGARAFAVAVEEAVTVEQLARALADYSQKSIDTASASYVDLTDGTWAVAWQQDVVRLRAEPTAERVWSHVLVAMEGTSVLHEQIRVSLRIDPADVAPQVASHAKNVAMFRQLNAQVSSGRPPPMETLRRVMQWMALRGAELGRRLAMLVLASKVPEQVPQLLPHFLPRDGRP